MTIPPASVCTPSSLEAKETYGQKRLGHLLKVTEHYLNELLSFIKRDLSQQDSFPSLQLFLRSPSPNHFQAFFPPHSWQESKRKRISNQPQRGNLGHDSTLPSSHNPVCSEVDSVTNQLLLKIRPGLSELCNIT